MWRKDIVGRKMDNQFHKNLLEALDFNEEYVSNRIFVVDGINQGERILRDLSRSVGRELQVIVVTPYELCRMICKEDWYVYLLYQDGAEKKDLYNREGMLVAAKKILKCMEKWKRQQFVFLENFRYFGPEMHLINCMKREQVTVVLQPNDKELIHFNTTNTYFKRYANIIEEVVETLESIVVNKQKPEECAIIYTQEAYGVLLEYLATQKKIALNHLNVPYFFIQMIEEFSEGEIPFYQKEYRNIMRLFEQVVDKQKLKDRSILEVFKGVVEKITGYNKGDGVLVMTIDNASFTGRKYLYVIGLNDKKLPVYDPQSEEILDDPKELEEAYHGGYYHEVIPLAKLLDVLGNHEGITYLSYACENHEETYRPAPFYTKLNREYKENPEGIVDWRNNYVTCY